MSIPFANLLPVQKARTWVLADCLNSENHLPLLNGFLPDQARSWYAAHLAPIAERHVFSSDYWGTFQNHPKLKSFVLDGEK